MLKVNVGLSRKLSRDYNSTGFSVNIEGEICAPVDDPELVVEKVKELYDLAEESLAQQIDRYEGESAIASRDEERPEAGRRPQPTPVRSNGRSRGLAPSPSRANSPAREDQEFIPATNKQVQFLMNLGKREGMTKVQLEDRVAQILGRDAGIYDLSKQEAGIVLDQLKTTVNGSSAPRGR